MKTNQFYIDSIYQPADKQFVMQLFNEAHESHSQELKDRILASESPGPFNSFRMMRLFEKTNHINQMRLIRILREIEIELSDSKPFGKLTGSILSKAQNIVYNRTEEQSRNYGDIQESMKRAAEIATSISGTNMTVEMIYYSIIAIKFSRQAHCHKEDNLLDAVAYMSALNDYLQNQITK